jgi:hypothetical protein
MFDMWEFVNLPSPDDPETQPSPPALGDISNVAPAIEGSPGVDNVFTDVSLFEDPQDIDIDIDEVIAEHLGEEKSVEPIASIPLDTPLETPRDSPITLMIKKEFAFLFDESFGAETMWASEGKRPATPPPPKETNPVMNMSVEQ